MPLLGTLLKKGIKIGETLEQENSDPYELQITQLRKLLAHANYTVFGQHYLFSNLLAIFRKGGPQKFYEEFRNMVPIHTYQRMYEEWWYKCREGEEDVCWPGRIRFFALSSGTSDASSKYIPITSDMRRSIQRTGIRQILSLSKYDLPPTIFEGGILMLGGSTHLNNRGSYFEGDLSGIQAAQIPFWFQHFYKPGKKIAKTRDWEEKLNEICRQAREWNITILVGVPAWIQLLMEKIIEHYKISSIHDIWPNLSIYVHGGVSFDPYRKGFEKLLGREIHYIETYLASEGFIGFQTKPGHRSMRLVINNGIFYEFIPFNQKNFDDQGNLRTGAKAIMINEVQENADYALLLSTNAGAWRYLIGDVIRFTSVEESEIIITGRTRHFLSLCGEHLSVDNMNKAIELVSDELNINIREYTVAGIPHGSLFAHHWFIGTDEEADPAQVKSLLDEKLKLLNDDYAVERKAALREVIVDVLPVSQFYKYLDSKGKVGGQNKFPRVIKSAQYEDFVRFTRVQS